jgi:hypothetical protein
MSWPGGTASAESFRATCQPGSLLTPRGDDQSTSERRVHDGLGFVLHLCEVLWAEK